VIKDSYGNTRFFGVYRGVVFSADDPLSKNRVRVKIPQILADNATQWAWPVGVVGTTPNVGDGVWVQFEGGDPAYPIWQGSFNENAVTAGAATSTITNNVTTISPAYNGTIDGGSA
jgi:hypothetical protein